jgi:uncharacterized protein (DUF111 family)
MLVAGLARMTEMRQEQLDLLLRDIRLPALVGGARLEERSVNAVSGWGLGVSLPSESAHRTLKDILGIIEGSSLSAGAKAYAEKAFSLLATAEAGVHGVAPAEVRFHEVGALDSILDICLAAMLFDILSPTLFVCSPLPLADGGVRCAHGFLPTPAPAVLALLEGVPVRGFPGTGETVTPTAIALLKAFGAVFGPWPAMRIERRALVYGGKIFPDAPNGALWACGRVE